MTLKEMAINAMWLMLLILFVTTSINMLVAFFKDKVRQRKQEEVLNNLTDMIKNANDKK